MTQQLIRVIVGSLNPVKVNAARSAIETMYPQSAVECQGMHAPSGVPDQPMTAIETQDGAINRVNFCREQTEADFYITMEGGVDLFEQGPATFAYVVIADKHRHSVARSASLPLPSAVYQALQGGEELGHVMDRLFNTDNVKQKGGAIGLLTNGNATRESIYTQALVLAMAPFLHSELFDK